MLHVNRAEPGGGRCETPLDFDEVLDLNDLRLAQYYYYYYHYHYYYYYYY